MGWACSDAEMLCNLNFRVFPVSTTSLLLFGDVCSVMFIVGRHQKKKPGQARRQFKILTKEQLLTIQIKAGTLAELKTQHLWPSFHPVLCGTAGGNQCPHVWIWIHNTGKINQSSTDSAFYIPQTGRKSLCLTWLNSCFVCLHRHNWSELIERLCVISFCSQLLFT